MKQCSLNEDEEFELMKFTINQGLIFFSSPFSREAFYRLEKFDVPAYKIGSGECNNLPLINEIASTKKPMILSTGMNTIDSIKQTMDVINKYHNDVALLHTTNLYPTPNNLVRLGGLIEISKSFPDNPFGLSDHTLTNHACFAAVALGASVLERHYTDHRNRIGPDIICSMDEKDCKDLIEGSNIIFEQRGGVKEAALEEKVTIDFAFASVCATKNIDEGEVLTTENIWVRRPGTGDFHAREYENILGKVAKRAIKNNTQIKSSDI